MFREMRRHSQQLSPEESREVLARCTSGVLAVSGDGGYPYAVPLSFAYREDKLYFHCAKTGHKLDALLRDNRAGFCVIDQDRIVSEEFTTYFRSVILFGRARILDDPDEKRANTAPICRRRAARKRLTGCGTRSAWWRSPSSR